MWAWVAGAESSDMESTARIWEGEIIHCGLISVKKPLIGLIGGNLNSRGNMDLWRSVSAEMMANGVDIAIIIPQRPFRGGQGQKRGNPAISRGIICGAKDDLTKRLFSQIHPDWHGGHTCLSHSNLIQNAKLRPVSFSLWMRAGVTCWHLSGALSHGHTWGLTADCWCRGDAWWPPRVIRRTVGKASSGDVGRPCTYMYLLYLLNVWILWQP